MMKDRNRFALAILLGLMFNVLILFAGELYLHVLEKSLPEKKETVSVLHVVLKNPVQENVFSPQFYKSEQEEIIIEEEKTIFSQQTEQSEILVDKNKVDRDETFSHFSDEVFQAVDSTESAEIEAVHFLETNVSSHKTDSISSEEKKRSELINTSQMISSDAFSESSEYSAEAERNKLYEMIYAFIEKEKQYPSLARRRNIEGQVDITINISADGTLYHGTISASSGSSILDTAAMNLVKKIFPLNIILQSEATITIAIRYSLND